MGKLINQTSRQYYEGPDGVQGNKNQPRFFGKRRFGTQGADQNSQYQFVSLDNIINQFMVVYVGEDKIITTIFITFVIFFLYL